MMERRRALTIPFTVDKDKLEEHPFRIPMTYLSSDCRKLEGQVSWTAFAGCKLRSCNSTHKNGSMTFDQNHMTMIALGAARRKARVVLKDVLKTELGKDHLERIKKSNTMRSREQLASPQKDSGWCKEEPLTCSDTWHSVRETRNMSKSVTPTSNQRTTQTPTSNQKTTQTPTSNQKPTQTPTSNQKTTQTPTSNQRTTQTPTSNQKTTQTPTSNQKTTQTPTSNQKATTIPESNQKTTQIPTSNQKTTTTSKSNQKTTTIPESNQKTTTTPKSNQKAITTPKSNQKTTTIPESNQKTTTIPESNQKTAQIPTSNQKTTQTRTSNQKAITTPKRNQKAITTPKSNQKAITTPKSNQKAITTPKRNQKAITTPKRNQKAITTPKRNQKAITTPKSNQKTTPSSSSQRSKLRRRTKDADVEEAKEENQDIEDVITGKNCEGEKFAEVVGCGLSLSREPSEDGADSDFSPDGIKVRLTDPDADKDVQCILSRKRRNLVSQFNGESTPKRSRKGVHHLPADTGDEEPDPTPDSEEEMEEDVDIENLDRCIVQFTVGEDDRMEALVPLITPTLEDGDIISNKRQSLLSSQDSTHTSPSEPIVLSSDDEESGGNTQRRSQGAHKLATVQDIVKQSKTSKEAVPGQQGASDTQEMEVVVDGASCSGLPSPVSVVEYNCWSVGFHTLHCGGFKGKANGGLVMAKERIIIPLKDTSKQKDVVLTLERKELRRYSVWDQEELEARGICFEGNEEPFPAGVLLFCVSETAAASIQQDLHPLCVEEDEGINTGKSSPFVLLTLRDPLVGMEGALLRSVLDMDCLSSLEQQTTAAHEEDGFYSSLSLNSPILSLDDSLELIKKSGLDPHLVLMLGLKSPDAEVCADQESSHSDPDEIPACHIWLDNDLQKEPAQELETAPEENTETQPEPEADQKEEEPTEQPDQQKEEAMPVYTLCRRRTRGSYSVSLKKPSSNWIKYKHKGLPHRLILFPPPPLKGGITVTMEDLQCLDSGQYLNDVIIDFYLKYLLQNASAAVAERSHIFSSFFYKQLTRRDNASEGGNSDFCQRQRRHQRVKTWTRHVDIFKKDFLFVPVNQEAHWYLVVICFPGSDEPVSEDWMGDDEAQGCNGSKDVTEPLPTLKCSNSIDTENTQEESTKDPAPCPVSCTEGTCQRKTVCKRPCILIMDSLKLSLHERVFKLLREYLQSEWEVRRGSTRDFGPDQMKSSHCQVPLQDNSSDCGLYLLQYVECFLKDPVVHFDLPLQLRQWFPRQQVRRKRDEIRDLILNLYRHQKMDKEHKKQLSC
ncbi:sentrin-specific protease 7 isoform X2 [Melanotaenia boesemani]|uniref:sentrin-specific protease 7 isoform X2 n=1 Tax=Melanotaenia boesemani TaxID=1250792 RepID=UPI001C057812|nr:sentrin-specific protease 7 isoform X2 [Melanotaenia boesemani]